MTHDEEDYEAFRLSNIAKNKALLESLGLNEFKIPDAPIKPSKSSKTATKQKKSGASAPKKRKGSDDTAVGDGEDEGTEKRARPPKRPKIDGQDSQDTLVETRRSSRNIRRVSYANDGAHIAAARVRALESESDYSSSNFDSEDDEDDELDDDDGEGEGGKAKQKKSKNTKKVKNGGRRLVQGVVDDAKQRNVAKMGERSHDP